ncbi:MAG: CHAD domain-containing protein [Gammaproteobacteria bacterium]|nr:CHAD domain-containing protein [Gammaproteobacteria bacterium]
MKRITLIRHGKSRWDLPALSDHERPLAPRGKRDSARMAAWAANHLPAPDLLLISTARRARATAKRYARIWPEARCIHLDELYLAGASALQDYLSGVDEIHGHVALVGHHPGLSQLAVRLAPEAGRWLVPKAAEPGAIEEPTLVTAAICSLAVPIRRWRELVPGSGRLDGLCTPRASPRLTPGSTCRFARLRAQLRLDAKALRAALAGARMPSPEAVHKQRGRIKRLRALLRLSAAAWSGTEFEERLRGLAGRYAALRDSDVRRVLKLDGLDAAQWREHREKRWRRDLPESRRQAARAHLTTLIESVAHCPDAALSDDELGTSLRASYRRARRGWKRIRTQPGADVPHRWRIRVKRLLLQLGILPDSPPLALALKRLDRLAELLGRHHDFALLLTQLPPEAAEALAGDMSKLLARACRRGERLFSKRRPAWLDRALTAG